MILGKCRKLAAVIAKAARRNTSAARRHSLAGPGELWKMKRRFQFRFLKERGLHPNHKLMDIGCGTLRGGIPLIEYLEPGHYCGIDASEERLQEAQKELQAHDLTHKRPRLMHIEDLDAAQFPDHYEFVWAYSVLPHMTDTIAETCMSMVSRCMAEDGAFYCNVDPNAQAENWQEYPVCARPASFYQELAERYGMTVEVLGTMASLGDRPGTETGQRQLMLRIRRAAHPVNDNQPHTPRPESRIDAAEAETGPDRSTPRGS